MLSLLFRSVNSFVCNGFFITMTFRYDSLKHKILWLLRTISHWIFFTLISSNNQTCLFAHFRLILWTRPMGESAKGTASGQRRWSCFTLNTHLTFVTPILSLTLREQQVACVTIPVKVWTIVSSCAVEEATTRWRWNERRDVIVSSTGVVMLSAKYALTMNG